MSVRVAHGLPANPRAIVGGRSTPSRQFDAPRTSRPTAIPSNPRPRAVSTHRRPAPETHERSHAVPHHRNPSEVRDSRRSGESVSTSSSSDSSYWSRGRSQNSSRTTLQSERDTKFDDQTNQISSKDAQATSYYIDPNFVWGRVTGAATALTQEVGKAWAARLNANTDDKDREEEESHLTRVMRAYHLSKARTPGELPDWLFSERERGQGGLFHPPDKSDSHGDGSQVQSVPTQQAQRRNRPTYGDNTVPLGTQSRRNQDIQDAENTKPPISQAKLYGSDRLKQLRELRRNAPNAF